MRITVAQILLVAVTMSVSIAGDGFSQEILDRKVSVELTSSSLKEALSVLERQAKVKFVYSASALELTDHVTLNVSNEKLSDVLDRLLQPRSIVYVVRNKLYIVLKPAKESGSEAGSTNSTSADFNQEVQVSGTVTDSNSGAVIPGVNVLLKGTTAGTVTDVEGRYSLAVAGLQGTLLFSYIGYVTQEVLINGRSTIDVTIEEDQQTLKEVVVVGYGTQAKKDLTGSVSSLNASKISKQPVSSFDQAMQGQMPGVLVSASTGQPGGNINIVIRGVNSISGGNQPLIVIDGFPVNNAGPGNPLGTIDPNDIASIEVLKDASATAIYGSRGSNGVVIVTTKRGSEGRGKIELNVYTGFQQPQRLLDLLNPEEYADFVITARNNSHLHFNPGGSVNDPNNLRGVAYQIPDRLRDAQAMEALGEGTDWQRAVFNSAPIQNYQLSSSGGSKALRYAVSGGYFNQQGIIINSGFERYSLRANVNADLNDKLALEVSLNPSYALYKMGRAAGAPLGRNIVEATTSIAPDIPIYDADGEYANMIPADPGDGPFENPVKIANQIKDRSYHFRLLGNMSLSYELLKGLKLKTSIGTEVNNFRSSFWKPSTIAISGAAEASPATASSSTGEEIGWLNENTLTYDKSFGRHGVNALAGYTMQKSVVHSLAANATNFSDDLVETLSGGQVIAGSETGAATSLISFLARVNYQFADKYLATITFRRDGSSRFGSLNRWGNFPSASIGWRLSEEDFMKGFTVLSDLKLRASYGLSGNLAIGDYRYIGLLSSTNYVTGNVLRPGISPTSFSNEKLGWETTKQFDVGLEFGVLHNRLSFEIDYYNRRNEDMLLNVQIPSATGYSSAWMNIGEVENKGLEFALNANILDKGLKWNSNFNISFNKNKVLKLGSDGERLFSGSGANNTHVTQVGHPIGSFFGLVNEGVFLNQAEVEQYGQHQPLAEPGDLRFKDVDGNGVLNDTDREIIGSPFPDFHFGFNNALSYKNFDLSVLLSGVYGNEMFWNVEVYNSAGVMNSIRDVYVNAWRSEDQPGDGKTPRMIRGARNNNFRYSSYRIFDGSFMRIRNVNIGYTLREGVLNKVNIESIRLYMSVNNLMTFTKYPGFDPEISNAGSTMTAAGVDFGGYPLARTFTFGINLSL